MSEENKDLNKSQSVADPDLNKDQSVAGQDLNQSVTEKQVVTLADGTDENKTVPYAEMKKAIDDRKTVEEQLQQTQAQMAILQANQQPAQSQVKQPLSDYDQAKTDLGLAGEEYMDESQRGKVYTRMTEIMNTRSQQSAAAFSNQQFESSHSDFTSVVGVRNPLTGTIQPTAEILKILTEQPHLTAAAYASSQGAYDIVMKEREITKLREQNTVQEEHLKQQGIDTKLAPVSGAAAAGGSMAAATGIVTVEQQREMEERVAAGEFNQKG